MQALLDGLTGAAWFADFDVFGREHTPGAPFKDAAAVRDHIATGNPFRVPRSPGD